MWLIFSQSMCENKLEEVLGESSTVKGNIIQRVKPYSTMFNLNDYCLSPTRTFAIEASISEVLGNLNA